MPKRIQMSRQKAWRADNPDAVIVDRRTRWGNPVKIGAPTEVTWVERISDKHSFWAFASVAANNRAEATAHFRDWMDGVVELVAFSEHERPEIEDLAGKDLACWCPLDQPCHADVLLDLANGVARG